MNTRIGKIARLPRSIRQELNERLRDGQAGRALVEWLNPLPEVQAVLAESFSGREITEQNLSDWKLGGYEDWLAQEEALARAELLAEEGKALATRFSEPMTEHLARVLAVRYAAMLSRGRRPADKEAELEFKFLRTLCKDVVKLRKGDHSLRRCELMQTWKEDRTAKQLLELFEEWTKIPDVAAWARIEWPDETRARDYLGKILKTDLDAMDLKKAGPSDPAQN